MDFQHRVAAWLAVRILAEADACPLWDCLSSSTLEFIRCETEQPVDDIMVGVSGGGLAFLQAKHSLSIGRTTASPFGKTVTQFVRQMLRQVGTDTQPDRPSDGATNSRHDRLVLAVGPTTPRTIASVLPSVLTKIRLLRNDAPLEEAAHSQAEKKALSATVEQIKTAWRGLSGKSPSDFQIRQLLCLIYVQILDVDPQGAGSEKLKTCYGVSFFHGLAKPMPHG
jgi:hypothetical protein